MIRYALPADAVQIARIYNHYVKHTTVTFEEAEVSAEEMATRIGKVAAAGMPWYVVEIDGEILGYAYATKWRERSAYRYSVESSVYLKHGETGKGYARPLYEVLIGSLREAGLHAVIGGIVQPNEASVRIHEKLGFEKVAQFREVGKKFGRWLDVGYWELLLK